MELKPEVDQWYRWNDELIQVTVYDEDNEMIEVTYENSDVEEWDLETWDSECDDGTITQASAPVDDDVEEESEFDGVDELLPGDSE